MAAPEITVEDAIVDALTAAMPSGVSVYASSIKTDMAALLRASNNILVRTANVEKAVDSFQSVGTNTRVSIAISTDVYITAPDIRTWTSDRTTAGVFDLADLARSALNGLELGGVFVSCVKFSSQTEPQIDDTGKIVWVVQRYLSVCVVN